MILLAEVDHSGKEVLGISFVRISDIRVLSLKNYFDFFHLLKPMTPRDPSQTPMTKLMLERLCAELNQSLFSQSQLSLKLRVDWSSFDLNDESSFSLQFLLNETKAALQVIADDQAGKESLKNIAEVIIGHSQSTKLNVVKSASNIVLATDFQDFKLDEPKVTIINKIESLL